ncbi:MAG TPA: YCF48-related protein [Thermoanaerobaculia bacterium]|nr:YCF48-related protein [Thermoanaerobaculia bacterium]
MEILSYPVGLLIGLFPVIVDLGPGTQNAELLLDGRPACTITARAPACTVDLGPDPVIHVMELVRKDRAGNVTEKVSRWVNKPGVEAEVHVGGACEKKSRSCDFTVTWAHPAKQDPASLTVAVDGSTVSRAVTNKIRAPFSAQATPQVVTADAVFPDGRRATYTRLLHGSYPEAAEASLQAVPVIVEKEIPDEDLAKTLREAGWPVRAVELGEFEVVFVVEPGVLEPMSSFGLSNQSKPLGNAEQIRAILANDSLTAFLLYDAAASDQTRVLASDLSQYGSRAPLRLSPRNPVGSWIRGLFQAPGSVPKTHRLRTSDAVAAAGYHLGGSSRRRAVVLIAGAGREDESTFSPEQARAYLGQTRVPLFVWRKDPGAAKEWDGGGGPLVAKIGFNIGELRRELDRQRIVWLEGRVDPRDFRPRLPAGITIAGSFEAGRKAPPKASRESDAVFTVTADAGSPGTVYAGTRAGLQVSRDGGQTWTRVKTGVEQGEVYAVAFPGGEKEIFFGSSGAIGRSIAGGESWAFAPTLAVFSILSASKEIAFAATRGGVFRTSDGGTSWIPSEAGMEKTFAFSLAADPRNPDVLYAATAGSGVFKSANAGQSWKPAGRELERTVVRCLVTDPANGDLVYAGTDGGVFATADGAASWQRRSSGLPRAAVYSLLADPSMPGRLFAGTAAGLFESRDGAKSWKRFPDSETDIQVTSLTLDPSAGKLYMATLERGVLVLASR